MKIALAQINTRVGDIQGNLAKIRDFAHRAEGLGAQLCVFPEQCLGGYPALDLWEEPGFIRANLQALRALAKSAGRMGLLVGFTDANRRRVGKPIHNAVALLHMGRVAAVRHKSLLPTYDVFDEARYFEPAERNAPIRFLGARLGATVCEDAWAPAVLGSRRLYAADPVLSLAKAGAGILINVSSSPFSRAKTKVRRSLFSGHARRLKRPMLYCNLVGGNDEMIFDGNSLAFDARGRLVGQGMAFGEDVLLVDTDAPAPVSAETQDETTEIAEALTLGIRDYVAKCGFERVFIGLSGGIDSAVTAALAERALGAPHVTGVSMPSPYSSQGSVDDARALAANLGLKLLSLPITPIYTEYLAGLKDAFAGRPEGLAEQNIQSRIRGNLLMALANKEGGLVVTTGNKSELSVGYCTLYGDMCGGLAALADVPKKTVYELARWFNREREVIPRSSIEKPPSAELKFDQKDQDDLPEYDVLDDILTAYIERRQDVDQIVRRGHKRALVEDILSRIDRAEYKRRQAPPSLKISDKAFGVGRRMPIARGSYR